MSLTGNKTGIAVYKNATVSHSLLPANYRLLPTFANLQPTFLSRTPACISLLLAMVSLLPTCLSLPPTCLNRRSVLSSAGSLLLNVILMPAMKGTILLKSDNTFIIASFGFFAVGKFLMNAYFGAYAVMLRHTKQLNSCSIAAFTEWQALLRLTTTPKFEVLNIDIITNNQDKLRSLIN